MRSELGYKNIYTSLKISISNLHVVRGNQPSQPCLVTLAMLK